MADRITSKVNLVNHYSTDKSLELAILNRPFPHPDKRRRSSTSIQGNKKNSLLNKTCDMIQESQQLKFQTVQSS